MAPAACFHTYTQQKNRHKRWQLSLPRESACMGKPCRWLKLERSGSISLFTARCGSHRPRQPCGGSDERRRHGQARLLACCAPGARWQGTGTWLKRSRHKAPPATPPPPRPPPLAGTAAACPHSAISCAPLFLGLQARRLARGLRPGPPGPGRWPRGCQAIRPQGHQARVHRLLVPPRRGAAALAGKPALLGGCLAPLLGTQRGSAASLRTGPQPSPATLCPPLTPWS